jgi:type VI secretion system VgrG family protein
MSGYDYTYHFYFNIDKFDGLKVVRFNGVEGVSRPFSFQIYFTIDKSQLSFDEYLAIGKPATLKITKRGELAGTEGQRIVNGVVSRVVYMGTYEGVSAYYTELVPDIWFLTQRHGSRIFQNKSVLEIIEDVINNSTTQGSMNTDFSKLRDKENLNIKREFCVQYRESDFDFISRLMEEEGIFYYFEHKDDHRPTHTLVLGNSPTCYKNIEDAERYPSTLGNKVKFNDNAGLVGDQEHIYNFRYNFQVLPGRVELRDHDFKKNRNIIANSLLSNKFEDLKFYDYPGKFADQDMGDRLAKIRIEEMRTKFETGIGNSNSVRLIPGYGFTLSEHQDPAWLNKKYLLLSVTHTGRHAAEGESESVWKQIFGLIGKGIDYLLSYIPSIGPLSAQQVYHEMNKGLEESLFDKQFFYSNDFECIPYDTGYRPPRLTPKPVVKGPQTAIVVGDKSIKEDKAKKELYMSEINKETGIGLGMAKVQFHWDKREKKDTSNCSCWIRVAYNYAGQNHGIQFHPLVGDEVVVDFLEGDPDKPLIIGSVYNGDNPSLLRAEDRTENIIQTPYQHRLMFSDREKTITLDTGGGDECKNIESLTMYDENSEYGNAIYLRQADGHIVMMEKSKELSGMGLRTELGHALYMNDAPTPYILLRDKTKKLMMQFSSDAETITIENLTNNKIIIKCQQGNVSVIGGSVDVIGGQVNINGSQSVSIKSDAKVSIEAPVIQAQAGASISLTAPIIKLDAPIVIASGAVNVGIGVVSPSYSPGVGNLV